MLPSWLRLLIVILLILLLINLFSSLPKMVKKEPKGPVAVLLPNKNYTCEVSKVEDCTLWCYDLKTATPLRLKPDNCDSLRGLKKGQRVHFEVLPMPYHFDGSVPVVIHSF